MPGGKKTSSPKITRSKTKQKKQEQEIEYLASLSSPVKSSRSKKLPPIRKRKKAALPTVSEDLKQATVNSPEREKGTIAQVVMEIKQNKTSIESSEEENSTRSESDLPVTKVKMSTPFDTKLKYLLNTYLYAKSDKHDIWQTFVENVILTYDEFVDIQNLESLKKMKPMKGNTSVDAFTDGKVILVNNALLYYNFLHQDDEVAEANDPTLWDKNEFRNLKSNGFPLRTNGLNATQAGNTANAANTTLNATNTPAPPFKTKLEEDAWLSWRWSKQDETAYQLLEADRVYTDWIVKFRQKIASEELSRMIDLGFHKNQLSTGADELLFDAQENHLASVLERVLQTSEGKRLTRKHPDDHRLVWTLHEAHATSSTTSSNICTRLSQELAKMKIVTFNTPTKGLDTFDSYLTTFNKISPNSQMPNALSIMYLKSATHENSDLLSDWTQCEARKENMTPRESLPTYDEYYKYLLGYA